MTTDACIPQSLIALLNQERGLGPVRQIDDLQARLQRRGTIMQQLHQIEEAVRDVQRQLRTLPHLPPLKCIQWAQAIQALPNLAFLEVDTTGLYEDAEIIRLVVMSIHGETLLDRLVTPSRPLSRQIATITGIEQIELQTAGIPITDALNQLRQAIRGTYILSYNLEFDEGKLREAVQRHQLDDITIIGEDLMARAMSYLQLSSYPKLEHLCKQIGQPLPPQSQQTALDRARGQIAVLNAMANAMLTAPGTPIAQSTDTDEDDERDEHPF
ncbi:hypothetical protein [Dictyobacter aurantiacus]|uniref:Exonuclease domain-containing protein n=1 Tax=Dictyobacter aurantiacus TaxID=1936993 RepID=A0A401ZD12_9CHLR|nr:hypothetical protein [Dictyobacter aurantiacus]GCE04774.1 hypothetical protein KDAU_21030 [Dictyobacter aurantiacus]